MTEAEAIKTLEDLQRLLTNYRHISTELTEANGMAINALEKQIAKKPKFIVRMTGIIKMYLCPCCTTDEEYTQVYPKQRHCEKCGQALLWEDSEV